MIKENQKLLNYMNIFTDAAVIVVSLVIAYIIRFEVLEGIPGNLLLPYKKNVLHNINKNNRKSYKDEKAFI